MSEIHGILNSERGGGDTIAMARALIANPTLIDLARLFPSSIGRHTRRSGADVLKKFQRVLERLLSSELGRAVE